MDREATPPRQRATERPTEQTSWRAVTGLRLRVVLAALRPHAAIRALRRRRADLPRLSRWAWTADITIAAVLGAATCYTAANPTVRQDDGPLPALLPGPVVGPPTPPNGPDPADLWAPGDAPIAVLVLAAACVLPLAVRRRFPLAAFCSVLGLTVAFHALYDTGVSPDGTAMFTFAACLLGGYSAARYTPFRTAALVSIAAAVVIVSALYEANVPAIAPAYVPLFVIFGIALAANAIHGWRQRLRAVEADRRNATERAVERERTRIARELHDVVTHHVSVMVIQAGAARMVLQADPERAAQVLRSVEASGREAMGELRDVMGLLAPADSGGRAGHGSATPGGDAAAGMAAVDGEAGGRSTGGGPAGGGLADEPDTALAPQPGLGQLEPLIDRMRLGGLRVDLAVDGEPSPLPAGADLAAYRVVQEALTNTMKHAKGARTRVTVTYRDQDVLLEVVDSGGIPGAAAASGSGRGLIGLRERLAVYGGTLRAGPAAGDGFRVLATIPAGAS